MPTFTKKEKSVNSKHLVRAITDFIEEGITTSHILWSSDTHREAFIVVIEDLLFALEQTGRASQGNVICDARNNKIAQMDQGIYKLEVTFKQRNCVNLTSIEYTIKIEEGFVLPDFDDMFP